MWREIYHEFQRWAKASGSFWATYRRTEITVETGQIWIVRKSHSTRGWCPECRCEVDMVSPKEAESLAGITRPRLSSSSQGMTWHWTVDSQGSPRVCVASVMTSRRPGTE